MLYRQAGSPKVNGRVSDMFSDCSDDMWYSNAVVWAIERGIATDVTESAFEPETVVTRQEMAGFLYRYIQNEGGGFTGSWMYDDDNVVLSLLLISLVT
jgi:hypothetical protein